MAESLIRQMPSEPPNVDPGPGDTVNLCWQTKKGRLLVNVRRNGATYYGDTKDGRAIRGSIADGKLHEQVKKWIEVELAPTPPKVASCGRPITQEQIDEAVEE
jgi:hypothetical protein